MLLPEHYKVGQRVRCVHPGEHGRTGKLGTISKVAGKDITIDWDDGYHGEGSWGQYTSFDPIADPTPTPAPAPVAKIPAPVAPVPLDVCKRHYYGIQEPCTCKK